MKLSIVQRFARLLRGPVTLHYVYRTKLWHSPSLFNLIAVPSCGVEAMRTANSFHSVAPARIKVVVFDWAQLWQRYAWVAASCASIGPFPPPPLG